MAQNNNEKYIDLLKEETKTVTVEDLPLHIRRRKKSLKLKMIIGTLIIISLLIFSSGILLYTDATSLASEQSITNSSDKQSDLLIGLPGQGFLLGSKTLTTWTNQTILQFLGIPYAESPSGLSRFKPPIPKTSWIGIIDASQYGLPCPEISKLNNTYDYNYDIEDCLSLNIFTKNLKTKLPVMVYIHGGGFANGSAIEFPPNYLLEKDVILVVIQYRLGALGFISTQSNEIPGNAGILDVILSLKWIQKYIQFFGGDPNKVTIFGQSSGSAMVTLLTLSPVIQNSKLFHQVIAQSGSIFAPWAINQNPIDTAKMACKNICNMQACLTIQNINECLINAKVKDLLKLNSNMFKITLNDFGGVLPKLPNILINSIKPKYSTMTGVTKHDGSYILSVIYDKFIYKGDQNIKPSDLFNLIIESINDDSTGIINNLLYREIFKSKRLTNQTFNELIPEFIDLCSILYFKSPALTFAKMNSRFNYNHTFMYSFDYEGSNTRFGYGESTNHYPFNGGSHHSDDYIYLFPYYFKNLNENDTKIAKNMVNIWTSFVIKGVPAVNETLSLLPIRGMQPYLKINNNITIEENFSDEFYAAVNDPNNHKLIKKIKY